MTIGFPANGGLLKTLRQDLRYALRVMLKNPGFTLAAMLTLALGIGGNTAIFTVTNAALLKSLPYEDPGKLVFLDTQRQRDKQSGGFSLNRYDMVRDHNRSFSGLAVFARDSFNFTGHGEPQQVTVSRVSPNFFSVLGLQAEVGRNFIDEEGQPAGKPVVMISDAFWHTRFGGDRNIVGQTVTLDSVNHTIIGVLPAGIQFPFMTGPLADVWSPRYFELTFMTPEHLRAGVGYLEGVARLRAGSSVQSARAEMQVLHHQYSQENPKAPDSGEGISISVEDLQQHTVANIRLRLIMLSVAVMVVLFIACFNVAGLLLSRALTRGKEIAIRTALGARPIALIRQLLTESMLLSVLSGLLGLGLALLATRTLGQLAQGYLPPGSRFSVDANVLGFTLIVSLLTGLAFGIFPAMKLVRTNVNSELRDEGRGTTGGHHRVQVKNILVVAQIALCMLLLIGAGLLIRSFARLQTVDAGFDPNNVLTMSVSLSTVKYAAPEQQIAFFDELLRKVRVLPGVQSAAISAALPLQPIRITPILPEGQPEVPLQQRPFIIIEAVSPAWFQTLHVPLKMGRDFRDQDNAQAPRVVIVNETLARRFWPNENPVGKHIIVGRQTAAEVVGMAADVKNSGLALDPQPQLYLPFPQLPWGNMNLLVRTAVEPHQLASPVQQQIYSIDRDQPITNVQTVEEMVSTSLSEPRLTMLLLGLLSAVALVLAMVGIYGVIAYSVAQRRPELGIRMALGAAKSDVLRLVLGQGLSLTAIGISIGLIAALFMSRLMSSFLYKVGTRDSLTFIATPVVFLVVGLLASYLPARRAMNVDPSEALRGSSS